MADKHGNVISRIECSFYCPKVFKEYVYKNIILGKIFPKSKNSSSLIDDCCYAIKTKDKHRIIFNGEKKYGRIIYINKDKDILYGRFINNNDKVEKVLGFQLKWKKE